MPPPAEGALRTGVADRLDRVRWAHRSGPYQALDLRFAVRTCDPGLGERLAEAFAALSVEGPTDEALWLSALDRGEGRPLRHRSYLGGRRLVATASPALLVDHLHWAVNREAVATARGAALVHAAAAERDGAVVLLPAPQESGKTTLVAGLLRRGYLYVTDEVVALDIASGRLRPYPKPLGLDAGSTALFPDLAPPPGSVGTSWHIPPSRLGAATMRPGATPRVLISPRYRRGAVTELTPLRPAEGLLLLAESSFNGTGWGQPGLSASAALVGGCPVIGVLTVGDLDAACDIVDAAVDEALNAGPSGYGTAGVPGPTVVLPTVSGRLVPAPGVASVEMHGEVVVLDAAGQALLLNATGSRLWRGFDGRRSVAEIASEASATYGHPQEATLADVEMFADELAALGVVVRTGEGQGQA